MFLKKIPVKAQKTGLKVSKDKKEGVNEIGFLTIKKLFQVNEGPVFVCFDFIILRRKMVLTPDGRGGSRPQRLGLSLSKPARTMERQRNLGHSDPKPKAQGGALYINNS